MSAAGAFVWFAWGALCCAGTLGLALFLAWRRSCGLLGLTAKTHENRW